MDAVVAPAPRWAQRVKQSLIRRLYETDAQGICDEELIEGNYHEVVQFLGHLTYGNASTPGLQESQAEWQQKINHTADTWHDESLRLA